MRKGGAEHQPRGESMNRGNRDTAYRLLADYVDGTLPKEEVHESYKSEAYYEFMRFLENRGLRSEQAAWDVVIGVLDTAYVYASIGYDEEDRALFDLQAHHLVEGEAVPWGRPYFDLGELLGRSYDEGELEELFRQATAVSRGRERADP